MRACIGLIVAALLWPIGFGFGSASAGEAAAGAGAGHTPPNILYIMTDQQRYDALGLVNPAIHTPSLDRLAKEGIRFDRMYVAEALCTPSRASIMSGFYPHTHRLQANVYQVDNALANPKYNVGTIWPIRLHEAGYHTGYIGKWHLGDKSPDCFDEWHGYNSLLGHWLAKPQKSPYRSDEEASMAMEFLEHNKDKKFALCVSFYPPHTPYDPPAKYLHMYDNSGLKHTDYWGGVSAVDDCIGKVIDKLDALGLRDNTLVIFTTDHGDHFGDRPGGSDHKAVPYDDAARVPLILRLPGVFDGGRTSTDLVSNVDLMPTILELTDLPLPKTLQGSSLIPLGSGDAKGWRTMTVTENGDGSGASRGIRTDRYKLILRVRAKEGVPGVYELYDLQKDPGEKTNLFAKDQAKTIGPILDQFEAWAKQTEDSVGLEMAGKCRKTLE